METIDTDYGTIGELEKFRRLIFSNTKTDLAPSTYLSPHLSLSHWDSPCIVLICFGFLQKLIGSSVDSGLRLFGSAVAGGVDMDSNGYPGTCASNFI